MGIIKQGILGGLSGKVGTVVGSSWKGIHYLRSLPSNVSNPRTPGQLHNRKKMDLLVKFLKACINLIRLGFGAFAVKKSAFNAATSFNYRNAFTGTFPNPELDFSRVMVSRGNLQPAQNASADSELPGRVSVTWEIIPGEPNANETDTAMVLIFNPATGTSVQQLEAAERSDGGADIDVPVAWQGDMVHCYVAFQDRSRISGKQASDFISDSAYAGEVEVM